MDTKPLRWGIMGCARISRRGLIPGIRGSRSGSLDAIASREQTVADQWAREFAIPRPLGSYEALVDDPAIDAVYIPLPNELHLEWVLRAADRGKHVLCEKPLALDAPEAGRMVEHCRSRGVILMEAFMWRHQPRTLAVRSLLDSGAIGKLRLIRASFSFTMEGDDWRLDPKRGGGALWDVGCYGVSTARLFAGSEPLRAFATAHVGHTGVDLSVVASLEFPGGILAAIDCSFEQPFCCRYQLVGDRGTIEVPDAYLPPQNAPAVAHVARYASEAYLSNTGAQTETLTFEPVNQYSAMVDAFAASVAAGALVDPAEDGLAQMHALDRLLASISG